MPESDPDHITELSAQSARQTRCGQPAFVGVIISTVLAAAALSHPGPDVPAT